MPPDGAPQVSKQAVCAKKGLYEAILAHLEPSGGRFRGLRRSIVRPEAIYTLYAAVRGPFADAFGQKGAVSALLRTNRAEPKPQTQQQESLASDSRPWS